VRALIVALTVAVASAVPSVAAQERVPAPTRSEATAVHVETGPAINGELDAPLWKQCPPWPMGACTKDDPQKHLTQSRVLFGPAHVYVGVWCEDPAVASLKKTVTDRDGPVYGDDSVEIFLRADPEEPYYQFAVNAAGALFDQLCTEAGRKDKSWNSAAVAKAAIIPGKGWSVTVRIPMKDLSAYVGTGQTWRVNICRNRPARGADAALEYSWALMSTSNYHSPREFGVVRGVNVPSREDGVTRVRKAPPPKPKTFEAGTKAGDVVVYTKCLFDKALEPFDPSGKAKLSLTHDSAGGRALLCVCEGKWSGPQLPLSISGSSKLKLAFLAKGTNFPKASLNAYDALARDNTTPYAHRYLPDRTWTPVLYWIDQFRYNSSTRGYVARAAHYDAIRFYGPTPAEGQTVSLALDNVVVYRGEDRTPPAKVTGLKASATEKGVELSWDVAGDNVAPMVYVVSRADGDGEFCKVAETHAPRHLDTTAGTGARRYRVFACDFEENYGPWSDTVPVRSTAEAAAPQLTDEQKDRLVYADNVRKVHALGKGKVRRNHVFCLGDSLTHATSYPQSVRAALGTNSVSSRGYPGMTTGGGVKRVDAHLQQENPEFMFVLYGTNDLNRKPTPEMLAKAMVNMQTIAEAAVKRGTVVLLGTVPPRGFKDPESTPEKKYNDEIAKLGRKLKLPVGYIFRDLQAAGDRKTYIAGDGIHWRGTGMAVAGKAWAKAMAQVRWVLRDQP